MPDDPPRPASGQQSDPRPMAGAPAWWGALGRPDLPLDGVQAEPSGEDAAPRPAATARVRGSRRVPLHWRAWAFNLGFLALTLLVICVGVGVFSLSMLLTVALVFGVPLVLASVTWTIVARRSH